MAKRLGKRKRRKFTPEFKAEAVRLCKVGDRGVPQVAKDLDLTETALREWVKRAEVEAGKGPLDARACINQNKGASCKTEAGEAGTCETVGDSSCSFLMCTPTATSGSSSGG